MSDPAPADPKALEVKYAYPDAEKDDAAIQKVESAIAQRFGGSFKEGLEAKNAPIDESEARAKIAEGKKQEEAERASGSEEVQKELKDSPPPKPGAPVKPQVDPPKAAPAAAAEPKKGGKGGAPAPAQGAKGKPDAGGAPKAVPGAPQPIVLRAASLGDGELDAYLDSYPSKGKDTTETLSKIKEMSKIAQGFDGKLDSYVASGSGVLDAAKGKVIDFLGKKEMSAIFSKNPYEKVEGGLGTLMRGLSTINNVVSIVGNVCSKIGLILTVVGLFGMIFPPIGAAVSAIARVLNIIGIVCSVLGLALSGVLTGLNGVVLAKQIGKGASNEEKAATADLMMSEANAAGGHIISLAMAYGPKFMKGFKSASKGVIGQLFKRFKGAVGVFATKTLGPVANWAKNIGYKLGFGLGKGPGLLGKAGGLAKKAWNAPGKLLEKARESSLVKRINNSKAMQGLERWSNSVNNSRLVRAHEAVENFAERAGAKAGAGVDKLVTKYKPTWGKEALEADIKALENAKNAAAKKNAADDAANREKARIERDIAASRKKGDNLFGETGTGNPDKALASREAYDKASELEAGKKKAVKQAERDAVKDFNAEQREAKKEATAAAKTEATENARIEEFKKDPTRFQGQTRASQTKLDNIEEKLADPNLSDAERQKLQKTADSLKATIAERRMISTKAAGGDVPETVMDLGKKGIEGTKAFGEVTGLYEVELFDDQKSAAKDKHVEEALGKDVKDATQKDIRHDKIGAWTAEQAPAPQTAAQVDGLLAGLDEELGFEPDGDAEPDADDADADADADAGEPAAAPPAAAGATSDDASDTAAATPAAPAADEPAPDEEKAPDIPELAYWPKLIAQGGEFDNATKDLQRMKQIAHAFHKSQVEAKKKALETAAGLGKVGEDAAKKQDSAQKHTGALQDSANEAGTSAGAAGTADGHGGKAADEQNKSKSQASGSAQQAPDPGDKPSRWHPIKRIWWHVKKWAADKAGKVFGWIQEKIASLVLQAICGVSMGDMKAYTTALQNRMKYSQLVGTQGIDAANNAMAEAAKAKSESKSHADQALDDAKECDENMADADAFIKNVEATEQELIAEHARATQFLASLHAAVQAERERQREEKAKKAAAAKDAAATTGAGPAPTPTPKPVPKPGGGKQPAAPKPLSPSAISKVKGAAAYVVSQANLLVEQLTASRTSQMARFKQALESAKKGTREEFEKREVGIDVVTGLQDGVQPLIGAMRSVSNADPTAAPEVRGHAGTVKSKAKELDELSSTAHDALSTAFKTTYEQAAAPAA